MANGMPAHTKVDMLTRMFGGAVVLKAILVDTASYTRDDTAHHFLSDVPTAAVSAVSLQITNVTITASGSTAVLDGDDAVCQQVAQSEPSAELVGLIGDTGDPTTSPLLWWMDSDPTGASLAMLFNNSDWVLQWPVTGILSV